MRTIDFILYKASLKLRRGLERVSLPHFLNDFCRETFVTLYSINYPNFDCQIAFTSWDIGQYVYCNYLLSNIFGQCCNYMYCNYLLIKLRGGLERVSLPYFLNDFCRKTFFTLHSINWPNFDCQIVFASWDIVQ